MNGNLYHFYDVLSRLGISTSYFSDNREGKDVQGLYLQLQFVSRPVIDPNR